MTITTTIASTALAIGVAVTGIGAAAPATAAPAIAAPATVHAAPTTAVPHGTAPSIDHVLVSDSASAPALVVGTAQPGAIIEVSYRGQTVTVHAGGTGTPTAGYWGSDLPGRQFGGGDRTITAVQIVDGERSAVASYEYHGFVLPF
ncbi:MULTISPECIES: hypothetical protein [unclassified Curtobacterium]|uniref:hypothetical protein n=1 Tax=unclassified Curtobacterium TaxID=257496 RepID=UPI000345A9C3|nr:MULTISPECIES: hypothetical protein [unclassified Curtobacterium]